MKKRVDYIFEGEDVEVFLSQVGSLADNIGIDYDILRDEEVVTYTFKVEYLGVTSSKLKIDFTTVNGIKRFDCQPLYISFAKKLALSNQLVDRRPKDKIDWYIVYCYLYPKGISKDDILTLLRTTGNSFKVNPMWLTQEGLSLALKSTKGFRGVDQANLEHVIFVTQSLLRGLDSRYVPKHAVFKGGEWVW